MSAETKPVRPAHALSIAKMRDDKPDEFPISYRGFDAKICTSLDGSVWRFHVSADAKIVSRTRPGHQPPQTFNQSDMEADLQKRAGRLPTEEAPADRTETVTFIQENWPRLSPLLYKGEVEDENPPKGFSYVDLGSVIADFIGVGTDGTVFILDSSENRKRRRLEESYRALEGIFPGVSDRIVPLGVTYTNETRSPKKKQIRLNVFPFPASLRAAASRD